MQPPSLDGQEQQQLRNQAFVKALQARAVRDPEVALSSGLQPAAVTFVVPGVLAPKGEHQPDTADADRVEAKAELPL